MNTLYIIIKQLFWTTLYFISVLLTVLGWKGEVLRRQDEVFSLYTGFFLEHLSNYL